jgi:hypothetical protein
MNRQFPVWREQGEGFGTSTRLISRIFFWRFFGGQLQLLGMAGLLSDGNARRTDTPLSRRFLSRTNRNWRSPNQPAKIM